MAEWDGEKARNGQLLAKEKTLEIGSVVRIFVKMTTPPKYKRFIILGHSDDGYVGVTLINSELNEKAHRDKSVQKYIIPLELNEKTKHFLDKDSVVDCTILHPISKRIVAESLLDDENAEHFGETSTEDFKRIVETVLENNRTIPLMSKKFFGLV